MRFAPLEAGSSGAWPAEMVTSYVKEEGLSSLNCGRSPRQERVDDSYTEEFLAALRGGVGQVGFEGVARR